MAADDMDRSEAATPSKLRDAHDRGQVARSAEVVSVAMLTCFTVVGAATAGDIGHALADASRALLLSAASVDPTALAFGGWLWRAFEPVLLATSPLLLALVVTAVGANLLQTGPVFSADPLTPDFGRINPARGFEKLFARRTLFELAKLVVKVIALLALAWYGLAALLPKLLPLTTPSIAESAARGADLAESVALAVLALLLVSAIVDLWFAKRDYARQMRMSRRELRDEVKRREGDPEVRGRRRRLQQELGKRAAAIARVPSADVVLTNPTHVAVALRYVPAEMRAPVVVAKGAGALAQRIRAVAHDARVPVVPQPTLARALLRGCAIDQAVPESAYRELVPIYRWLMARTAGAAR